MARAGASGELGVQLPGQTRGNGQAEKLKRSGIVSQLCQP
jgi:hypothetical protein